jgi:hypothetical protein
MGTNRTPWRRTPHPEIPPEAVQLFQRAWALDPVYSRCVRGKCQSTNPGTRCPECAEYLALRRELAKLVSGLPAWEPLVASARYRGPSDPHQREAWLKVQELISTLQAVVDDAEPAAE